jgi:tRNA(Ile)-lysidine synthase
LLVQALEKYVPEALERLDVHSCRIGLSGGADSLALTAAAAWARDCREGPLAGVGLSARIIDHGLQDRSHEIAEKAAVASENLGVSADIVAVSVDSQGQGVESAAREARYRGLNHGEDALLLLGHTLDDQAETVLLGLARGSGTRSLAGMPRCRDRIVRPFLHLRRRDTVQACQDWGLTWWEDPMNTDPAYTRARLRQVMPTLEEALGPGVVRGLGKTADLSRRDADYLDEQTEKAGIDVESKEMPVAVLQELHPALRHRIILLWLRQIGDDAVTKDHVEAVDSLITQWHGQKSICVPSGRVVRQSGELIMSSE